MKAWSEVTTVSAPVSTSAAVGQRGGQMADHAGDSCPPAGGGGSVVEGGRGSDEGELRRCRSTLRDALKHVGVTVGDGDGGLGGDGIGDEAAVGGGGGGGVVRAVVQGVDIALDTDLVTLHAQLKCSDHFLHVCVSTPT